MDEGANQVAIAESKPKIRNAGNIYPSMVALNLTIFKNCRLIEFIVKGIYNICSAEIPP